MMDDSFEAKSLIQYIASEASHFLGGGLGGIARQANLRLCKKYIPVPSARKNITR